MEFTVQQLQQEANPITLTAGNVPLEQTILSDEEKAILKKITKDNIANDSDNLQKRKKQLSKNSVEPVDFAYERAIGKNDSLYSNFAELIALTKRKVCRIVTKEDGGKSYGTGFMVSKRLLLTNWHVFKNKKMAEEGEAHFFYEYDAQGRPSPPVIFRFDTKGFINHKLLDYCFVAVEPMDVTGKVSLESIGYLYLDPTTGKVGAKGLEKLNIIHHPMGDYKQISIRENTFKDITKTKLTYETDTAPGSSGSPVLNDQWQVVGLHHKSVAKMEGKNYVDKDGIIIPIKDGKVDATRLYWVKNEGIRISVILKHVFETNPNNDLIAGLAVPPPSENLYFTTQDGSASAETDVVREKKENSMAENDSQHINITVPVNALSPDQSIEISLSRKRIGMEKRLEAPATRLETIPAPVEESGDLFLEEARKVREFDFCKGYDPNFLGVAIPLPQPQKSIKNQIAHLIDVKNEIELKYFKYSVIFNKKYKMPLISAVNVEGDSSQRLDLSKRKDVWQRDSRIAADDQLSNDYYLKSGFARGHMSRFEDANWGDTEEDALRNGIYTCFHTNACPQVQDLNGPGGLWGQLEKAVLEQGIKKEKDKAEARMTVFNGPIFNEEKDKLYKGVRVPFEFYKIVCWLNDSGELKATAFRLSQETLVGDIDFDETKVAEEALDIDKNVKFKHFQCSIKSLGNLTNIDFEHLEQFDTFVEKAGGEENLIEDTESITL